MLTAQRVPVLVPPPVTAPRGADWAARSMLGLAAFGQRLWRGLEVMGRRRAARELLQRARRWESIDPEHARQLRHAARFDTQEDAR